MQKKAQPLECIPQAGLRAQQRHLGLLRDRRNATVVPRHTAAWRRSRLNGYFAAVEAQELYEEGRRGIGTWAIGSGDRGVVIVLGWSSRLDAGARARGLMAT